MSLLSTHNLSIGYPTRQQDRILQKDINVTLNKGELVCLLGQNGVGKTTFIKTISGLIPPILGKIKLGNGELKDMSKSALARHMSLVLTERPSAHNLSVIELIALGRYPYSNWIGKLQPRDMEVIEAVMDQTNISYIGDRKLFELSDGQFQIAMIARALAQETDLLILDEPTAHLDIQNKIIIAELLKSVVHSGKSILISTHDIQISTQLADRLWLFNFNTAIEQGLPEDMILKGSIHKTFFIEKEQYDLRSGTLNLDTDKTPVEVKGTGEIRFWTERALRRYGFFNKKGGNPVILCNPDDTWDVIEKGKKSQCKSLVEVLGQLRPKATPEQISSS